MLTRGCEPRRCAGRRQLLELGSNRWASRTAEASKADTGRHWGQGQTGWDGMGRVRRGENRLSLHPGGRKGAGESEEADGSDTSKQLRGGHSLHCAAGLERWTRAQSSAGAVKAVQRSADVGARKPRWHRQSNTCTAAESLSCTSTIQPTSTLSVVLSTYLQCYIFQPLPPPRTTSFFIQLHLTSRSTSLLAHSQCRSNPLLIPPSWTAC